MTEDMRSRQFLFIPFCLICQAFQARGIVRYGWRGMIRPIVEELVKRDINLVQMPCPESQFGGYEKGLDRNPMGIAGYDNTQFRQHCKRLALRTMNMISAILARGYDVMGVLGIEYSPSCAIKYQYGRKGTMRREGIFIEELKTLLDSRGIKVRFVGINRRGVRKTLSEIRGLFNPDRETELELG